MDEYNMLLIHIEISIGKIIFFIELLINLEKKDFDCNKVHLVPKFL